MTGSPDPSDSPASSRADLDIELARLALRLERAASYVVQGMSEHDMGAQHAALADWFSTISDEIVGRADPRHRRYAQDRIDAIAAACPALANPNRSGLRKRRGKRSTHGGDTHRGSTGAGT